MVQSTVMYALGARYLKCASASPRSTSLADAYAIMEITNVNAPRCLTSLEPNLRIARKSSVKGNAAIGIIVTVRDATRQKLLFRVSGEKRVPSCTMNCTEDGAKGHQEQGVQILRKSMAWDIERRNVCGASRE